MLTPESLIKKPFLKYAEVFLCLGAKNDEEKKGPEHERQRLDDSFGRVRG